MDVSLKSEDDGYRLREVWLEEVRHEIRVGIDELDRGEGIDGWTVLAEVERQSEALRKRLKR